MTTKKGRGFRALLLISLCLSLWSSRILFGHQLDEYVGLTHIEIRRDRVQLSVSLTPGAEIVAPVLADIDRDADGVLSTDEQRVYADTIVAKLALAVDDERPALRLRTVKFPAVELLRQGQGVIQLTVEAAIEPRDVGGHSLFFANNNSDALTVYVVGVLKPEESGISIGVQERDWYQRHIRVSFEVRDPNRRLAWFVGGGLGALGLCIITLLVGARLREAADRRQAAFARGGSTS